MRSPGGRKDLLKSASGAESSGELEERRKAFLGGGGPEKVAAQRKKGKLTARERMDLLFDPGTFQELGLFVTPRGEAGDRFLPGDGVVTGYGRVEGRLVFAFSQDFTVQGGTLGEAHADKICRVLDLALRAGAPVVGINDSGGARIQEGVSALEGYARIFARNAWASGVVPQISVIAGPSAGGAVYSPALTDFVFMVEGISYMFITGPEVVRAVTGEEVSFQELGGAEVQASRSGVAHFLCSSEEECFRKVRRLLSYLPSNSLEDPPFLETDDSPEREDPELDRLVPPDPQKGYEVREVVERILDRGSFFEVMERFAPNAVVGFGRLGGRAVGVVANQPRILAGCLDIDASDKIARFVRFCDCFNLPLLTFVDTPGYLPGRAQEHGGIIRHGAKVLYAYAEATVPKLSVILRKAYGGAYIAMCCRGLGADLALAWPGAEIAVMGPEGAARIIYRQELEQASDPEAVLREKVREYREKFAHPYFAAGRGYVDDVVEPRRTRSLLIAGLGMLEAKREERPPKKHGNIPL